MRVIRATNVNDALIRGLDLFRSPVNYREQTSRNGLTREVVEPVTTVYTRPMERVLFSDTRDANPFFHLIEALWILAGRRDVRPLARFNPRMADYSDSGYAFHGAYGWRLRAYDGDYLKRVVDQLRRDPDSRQAVLAIWRPELDAAGGSRDIPCNDMVMFKVRDNRLNMSVLNRSNDMLWGAYGANAVQFAFLLEYVAAAIGVAPGEYRQVSDSFHVYADGPGGGLFNKLMDAPGMEPSPDLQDEYRLGLCGVCPIVPAAIDRWANDYIDKAAEGSTPFRVADPFLWDVVAPMIEAFNLHRDHGDTRGAMAVLAPYREALDWHRAGYYWLERRLR